MQTDPPPAPTSPHEAESLPLWNRHFFLLAAFAFLILFVNLHRGDLSGYDDAFHADQGKQILRTGDWWTLRHNGYYNPQFPPLFYWLEALSMKIWGVNDFAAKFPAALLGWGTIVTVYLVAWELTGQVWLSLLAMLVLMSTQYFMKYATHAMTDVPFAFFVTLGVLFYVKGTRQPRWFPWSALAVGLAMLTRPAVGVIPLGIFLAHLLWTRRGDLLASRHIWGALALAVAFPVLWYAVQYHWHGAEAVSGPFSLMSQQLTSRQPPDVVKILVGSLEYPKLLLRLYWPWLPLLLIGLWWQARTAWREREFAATLLVMWVAGILVPFSLGEAKQLRYVMSVFPAFAILAAMPLHRWIPARSRELCFRVLYALGATAVVFMFFFPGNLLRAGDMQKLARIAQAHSRPDQRVILYTHGGYEWGYQNQLLWYGDRFTDFQTSLETVREKATAEFGVPVVMDKESFANFIPVLGPEFRIEALGESELFLCFRVSRSG